MAGWDLPWWMISHSAYGYGSLLRLPVVVDGHAWTLHKIVDLKSFPALSKFAPASSYIIAAADAVGVFVVWVHGAGVVTINVKSGRVRRVFRDNIVNIIPYISFCTPGNCLMCVPGHLEFCTILHNNLVFQYFT